MRKIIFGFALMVALAAPSGAALAEKYQIDQQVWGWYQQYLRNIANGTKPGAFAISTDGHGAFYSWCQDIRCVAGTTYSQDALNYCERNYNTTCVVFAVRDEIKVEYEIAATVPSAPSTYNPPPPPPPTRITVSPAVKAEIDTYLHNTHSAAQLWALAIAKDGSRVKSGSCPAGGGYTNGGCNNTHGSAQDLAGVKAIKECGGAAKCILLYRGDKKAANIELIVQ